jgi:starch synthase
VGAEAFQILLRKVSTIKIALLTNEFPPHVYGGAGVHVTYLTRELARLEDARHSVLVFCFGEQKETAGNATASGIGTPRDLPFQDPRHQKLLDALARNVAMVGSVKEADIVHCHTWYTHLAGCLLKQILGAPLVLTVHSLEPHRPWKEEQLGSAFQASSWVERTAYENADGVIAVSQPMKAEVHELYKVPLERIRVIQNGIDLSEYRPTFNNETLISCGINPQKRFILFVGRLTRQKGIIHLLEALPHLDTPVQVVLCAGEPDTPVYAREVEETVQRIRAETEHEIIWIPEAVPRDRLVILYSHASLFVCPSVYEPFGIVNLEAMACGTPVVASAVGGIPEAVSHGETGFLVPFEPLAPRNFEPRDPGAFSRDLAAAMNRILRSPEIVKEMGRACRKRVEQHFSWKKIAQQTLDFYWELRNVTGSS